MQTVPPHDLIAQPTSRLLQRLNHLLDIYTTDKKELMRRIEFIFHDSNRDNNCSAPFSLDLFINSCLSDEQRATLMVQSNDLFTQHVYDKHYPEQAAHREVVDEINKRLYRPVQIHFKLPDHGERKRVTSQPEPVSHEQQAGASFPGFFWETIHSAPFHILPQQRASEWVLPTSFASDIQRAANQLLDKPHEQV